LIAIKSQPGEKEEGKDEEEEVGEQEEKTRNEDINI